MKLCRFQPLEFPARDVTRSAHEAHPQPRAGILEGTILHEIRGGILDRKSVVEGKIVVIGGRRII